MKIKQSPEDFRVEELTDVKPGDAGEFAFYKLEKTGWTTPDALAAIRRRWKIDLRRLSYGGLKDRHAQTIQYLTIYRGPQRNLAHERVELTYLGRVRQPFSASDIRANRFEITLRSLDNPDLIESNAKEIEACGVPNYFDDQRFGSVGRGGQFIALEMIRGNFEEALKLALMEPYEFDRAEDKKEKAILKTHWGDWTGCKAKLPRGHARSLVDYLVHHPADFKGAAARLRPDLSGLYLSAYQSHVWNKLLAKWLLAGRASVGSMVVDKPPSLARPADKCFAWMDLKLGAFPAPRIPLPAFDSLSLPLPSARLKSDPDADWRPLLDAVLAEDGITLETMRIRGMDRPYFSKGDRPACLRSTHLSLEIKADTKHSGRKMACLRFELPRGAYATMIAKRLAAD